MSFVHACSYGLVVAFSECVADIEDSLLLTDHIACAEVVFLLDLILYSFKLIHCRATEEFLSEYLCNALA